jgi:very-short-patch-repair endonuclease
MGRLKAAPRRPNGCPGAASPLARWFARVWQNTFPHLPRPVLEHRFHPVRRWRFDLAWPELQIAVEIDGGQFVKGRHLQPRGFQADCEKLNAAALHGWSVLRYTTRDVQTRTVQIVEETAILVRRGGPCPGHR